MSTLRERNLRRLGYRNLYGRLRRIHLDKDAAFDGYVTSHGVETADAIYYVRRGIVFVPTSDGYQDIGTVRSGYACSYFRDSRMGPTYTPYGKVILFEKPATAANGRKPAKKGSKSKASGKKLVVRIGDNELVVRDRYFVVGNRVYERSGGHNEAIGFVRGESAYKIDDAGRGLLLGIVLTGHEVVEALREYEHTYRAKLKKIGRSIKSALENG